MIGITDITAPSGNWICDTCGTVTAGPENTGYTPHCPACGAALHWEAIDVAAGKQDQVQS